MPIPMSTYYLASRRSPNKRTKVKARGLVSARCAYLRKLGHTVVISPSTHQPIFEDVKTRRAYDELLAWQPARRGRNPGLIPCE